MKLQCIIIIFSIFCWAHIDAACRYQGDLYKIYTKDVRLTADIARNQLKFIKTAIKKTYLDRMTVRYMADRSMFNRFVDSIKDVFYAGIPFILLSGEKDSITTMIHDFVLQNFQPMPVQPMRAHELNKVINQVHVFIYSELVAWLNQHTPIELDLRRLQYEEDFGENVVFSFFSSNESSDDD